MCLMQPDLAIHAFFALCKRDPFCTRGTCHAVQRDALLCPVTFPTFIVDARTARLANLDTQHVVTVVTNWKKRFLANSAIVSAMTCLHSQCEHCQPGQPCQQTQWEVQTNLRVAANKNIQRKLQTSQLHNYMTKHTTQIDEGSEDDPAFGIVFLRHRCYHGEICRRLACWVITH